MQASSHSGAVSTNSQSTNIAGLNGRLSFAGTNGPGQHNGPPDNFIFENVDPAHLDGDDDSDAEMSPTVVFARGAGQPQGQSPSGLKPGKKTKGRVKIKMEFIENKLRRYTTFSKRKTGIMKKAYELSTLTGTQVMLLVASETGHVYTFATRKLQPMITSDSGKALIQTCLNSPDPPPGSTGQTSLEQRMNPSGFEETELTYSVGEEDSKLIMDEMGTKPVFQMSPHSNLETNTSSTTLSVPSVTPAARQTLQPASAPTITSFSSQPIAMATQSSTPATTSDNSSAKVTGIPVQFPSLILQTGTGQPLTIPAGHLSMSTTTSQPQAVYRAGQIVTNTTNQNQTTSSESSSAATTPSLSFLSGSGTTAVTPGQIIMYQTPQGVVYAAPTPSATLGTERTIFNFQQPATAISIPQSDTVGGGQQIITIPVPVSLANAQQVLQFSAASTGNTLSKEVSVPTTPSKKPRKG